MSTTALTLMAHQASAKSWQDIIMDKHGILTNPHLIHNMTHDLDTWIKIGNHVWSGMQWITNLPDHLPKYSVQIMTSIFNIISNVTLNTPLFIFDNPVIQDKTLIFSGISVLLVILATALNGIKRMCRKQFTPLKSIMPKFFTATIISGMSPFLFKTGFSILNKLCHWLNDLTNNMSNLEFINHHTMGFFDGLMLGGFDLVSFALLIPILLKTGKRWFDLLCLSAITPLAMTAYVFDETKHLFNKWFNAIIIRGQTQVVYAFFLFIMSVFIFGTVGLGIHSVYDILMRLLILVGGLITLANPPEFVTRLTDNVQPIKEFGKDIKQSAINTYRTLTFNKFAMARNLYHKFRK
jgi:hypothetical protein